MSRSTHIALPTFAPNLRSVRREFAPILVAILLFGCWSSPAAAKDEKRFQRLYCVGMELEHRLPDNARIDCLNGEFAIEVDYVDHWAESVGQALYYAGQMKRKPGIIMLCPTSANERVYGECLRDFYRLDGALKLVARPVTVWAWLATRVTISCARPMPASKSSSTKSSQRRSVRYAGRRLTQAKPVR